MKDISKEYCCSGLTLISLAIVITAGSFMLKDSVDIVKEFNNDSIQENRVARWVFCWNCSLLNPNASSNWTSEYREGCPTRCGVVLNATVSFPPPFVDNISWEPASSRVNLDLKSFKQNFQYFVNTWMAFCWTSVIIEGLQWVIVAMALVYYVKHSQITSTSDMKSGGGSDHHGGLESEVGSNCNLIWQIYYGLTFLVSLVLFVLSFVFKVDAYTSPGWYGSRFYAFCPSVPPAHQLHDGGGCTKTRGRLFCASLGVNMIVNLFCFLCFVIVCRTNTSSNNGKKKVSSE